MSRNGFEGQSVSGFLSEPGPQQENPAARSPEGEPAQAVPSHTSGAAHNDTDTAENSLALLRMKAEAAFGQIVMAMSALPRYRHLPLSEVDALVLQPLMRNRIAVATASPVDSGQGAPPAPAGFAVWASVSDGVDARIREQIAAGVFPVRLGPEDWVSGRINWLLDVIAPDARMVTAVLANFRKLADGGDLRLHPAVSKMVPPETLEKMGASRIPPPESDAQAARPAKSGAADA